MEPMENNGIWIKIQFNDYNQLENTDELVTELKKICPVQASTKWYPAACTGMEFLLSLNLNLSFSAFLNNVLIPGLEFAGFCKVLHAVWNCFDKFFKKNEGFDLQKLELTFDDVTLIFYNVMSYGALLRFYYDMPDHIKYLENHDIHNISLIKLPYIEYTDDETDEKSYREWSLEDGCEDELYWKIIYERGCERCYYNPNKKEITV